MILIKKLSKSYNSVIALDNFSLDIAAGEKLVVRGPSGSGKTTLLRLIAGLEIPDKGEIFLAGERVSSSLNVLPAYKRNIGFVFQRSALWPHMNVKQNIRFVMPRMSGREQSAKLEELLEKSDLLPLAERYPQQLSGGEARRVAVIRALAAEPKILLLDEPLTSLDSDLNIKILDLIQDYSQNTQATTIFVTHIEDEVHRINGRQIFLRHGKLELV